MFVFTPDNSFRKIVAKIVFNRFFDPFILFLILFSTILLAIDNPLDNPNGDLAIFLNNIDIAITSLFALEAVLKIIVYGLIFNGPESYLRVSWNIMDILIVIFSVII